MRILHWNNTANQGTKIARIHRALGHPSDVAVMKRSYFEFDTDYDLHLNGRGYVRSLIALLRAFVKWAPRYDVFHLHECSILPGGLDIPILRRMGKKVIVHYHGSEIRRYADPSRAATLSQGPYGGVLRVLTGMTQRAARRFANAVLVSTPDLLPYVSRAIWIRQPTDLEYWRPSEQSAGEQQTAKVIKIGHSPSTKSKKGTPHVVAAVEKLKSEGYAVELVTAHGLPHEQVKPLIEGCDLFVDQLLVGWYGNAACEAMALEKPVCVYIRPDLERYLSGCPVVNANPDHLYDRLRWLIENPAERTRLGELGRKYVQEYHDVNRIAANLIRMYESLPA